MLQYQRALQVTVAVQAAGQAEVALQVCPRKAEQLQDGLRSGHHSRHYNIRLGGKLLPNGNTSDKMLLLSDTSVPIIHVLKRPIWTVGLIRRQLRFGALIAHRSLVTRITRARRETIDPTLTLPNESPHQQSHH